MGDDQLAGDKLKSQLSLAMVKARHASREGPAAETKTLVLPVGLRLSAAERRRSGAALSRLETVKQVFFAFGNRMKAYNYATDVGLVSFGSEVTVACAITPFFDLFREKVDDARASGDTKLYGEQHIRIRIQTPRCRRTPCRSLLQPLPTPATDAIARC